jgi:NAD+ kinase
MKIFFYGRPFDRMSAGRILQFKYIADRSGLEYVINREYSEMVRDKHGIEIPYYETISERDVEEGSVMITIGGDGTLLEAVYTLKGLPVPIAGVNTGRLGFLAGITPEDFEWAVEKIKQGDYTLEKRPLLTVEGDFGMETDFPCVLNELAIYRHEASMVEITASVNGEMLATIRGDGAVISTPTGSTGYSLSAGGPVVSPLCECMVMTALAPHHFTMRPIVLPDTSTISLEIYSRGRNVAVSLDNRSFVVPDGACFTVRKSEYSAFFMRGQNISFYETLRNKMMWGADNRAIHS